MSRINAPTPYVWIIGRTRTDGPPDYDAVHKIQAATKSPRSRNGASPAAGDGKDRPNVDMKTPPKIQVDAMPADKFYAYAAELLKVNPPHITDQPMIAELKKVGFEPGKSFSLEQAAPAIRRLFRRAEEAQKLMAWKVRRWPLS
jgi:hypothetical protein